VIRYLCSELVALKREAVETVVNLEEIWDDGAAIEMDDGMVVGQIVQLKCGDSVFPAKVTLAAKHEFGWRVEMEFASGTKWSPEVFRPQHMLDPQELLGKKVEG
jgi:hypothetical protein